MVLHQTHNVAFVPVLNQLDFSKTIEHGHEMKDVIDVNYPGDASV